MKKIIILFVLPTLDFILSPFVVFSALLLWLIKRIGVYRLHLSKCIFNWVGVFPIRDHYYEPMFNTTHLKHPLNEVRELPGIDWNASGQLEMLAQFDFNDDLKKLNIPSKNESFTFSFDNPNFRAGDADFFYNMIRLHKPQRIVEIGSGASTLLARAAIDTIKSSDKSYACKHVCIEPYEMAWLESINEISVMRDLIENVPLEFFSEMESGDILFIDSSHVIRPQGDVLREYLQILPSLKSGVFVHIHDIFSPRDYPEVWIIDQVRLWNEQYLLEAFLSFNNDFEIVGAVNYLKHEHLSELSAKCPIFAKNSDEFEPGSFWLRRK